MEKIENQKKILIDFISNRLCKRPSLFVGSNDFEKVAHFFNGYTQAIQEHLKIDLYRNWIFWIAKELNTQFNNSPWWSAMVQTCGSNEKAIESFPILFAKFLSSKDFQNFNGRE